VVDTAVMAEAYGLGVTLAPLSGPRGSAGGARSPPRYGTSATRVGQEHQRVKLSCPLGLLESPIEQLFDH
jgi:hypothetical protein